MQSFINDFFQENINSWLYIEWAYLTQDIYGEPVDFYYPISLTEMSDFLNGKISTLSQKGELHFWSVDGVFHNQFQKRHLFDSDALYEAELKKLYKEHQCTEYSNDIIDSLNTPSILLKLVVPCSKSMSQTINFPMSLNAFFKLMKDQYEHPEEQEIIIEDIPF